MSRHRAPKVCGRPGCPNLTEGRDPKCPQHTPSPFEGHRERRRQMTGVTSGWAEDKHRKRALERDRYRCVECGAEATEVDHIVPIMQGGTWALDNLQSLCDFHHRRKTQRDLRH